MNIFFQRFVLFLLLVIVQRSFLDVIWSTATAPALVIALIVSLVFLEGFERGGMATLLVLVLYVLLGQSDRAFVLFAVLVAYGTSFLSRRLVTERPVQTSFVLALASTAFVLAFDVFTLFLHRDQFIFSELLSVALQALIVFPMVFFVIRAWEKYVRENALSEFRGMRT